jgi:hypothetical protein
MAKSKGPHPPPLPPLRKDCTLHQTVMRAIARGYATSWSGAYVVGLYLSNPRTRAAGQEWFDFYGVPRSRFSTLLVIDAEQEKFGGENN